jgi:TPR repeat protein
MLSADWKLNLISEFEKLLYKAAEYLDNAPRGSQVSYIDVFGENASDDEYLAWTRVAEIYFRYDFYHEAPYTYWRNIPKTQAEMDEVKARASRGDTYSALQIVQVLMMNNRYDEAIHWLEVIEDSGNSDALVRLAGAYKYGLGVPRDMAKAVDYLKQAILLDSNDEALRGLATDYIDGDGVPRDEKMAFDLMIRSARQGNALARYDVGWMYDNGRGVEVDIREALKWYELSARGYYLKAYTNLTAICHDTGDYERMLSWTRRYMELDEPRAFMRMGSYLMEGCGVEKNVQKGLEYIEKAAERDDSLAYYELGRLYGTGEGVEVDLEKSFRYMSEAARLREPHAEFLVGTSIWDSDREKALSMINDAASQRYDLAAAFLMERGYEVPPSSNN